MSKTSPSYIHYPNKGYKPNDVLPRFDDQDFFRVVSLTSEQWYILRQLSPAARSFAVYLTGMCDVYSAVEIEGGVVDLCNFVAASKLHCSLKHAVCSGVRWLEYDECHDFIQKMYPYELSAGEIRGVCDLFANKQFAINAILNLFVHPRMIGLMAPDDQNAKKRLSGINCDINGAGHNRLRTTRYLRFLINLTEALFQGDGDQREIASRILDYGLLVSDMVMSKAYKDLRTLYSNHNIHYYKRLKQSIEEHFMPAYRELHIILEIQKEQYVEEKNGRTLNFLLQEMNDELVVDFLDDSSVSIAFKSLPDGAKVLSFDKARIHLRDRITTLEATYDELNAGYRKQKKELMIMEQKLCKLYPEGKKSKQESSYFTRFLWIVFTPIRVLLWMPLRALLVLIGVMSDEPKNVGVAVVEESAGILPSGRQPIAGVELQDACQEESEQLSAEVVQECTKRPLSIVAEFSEPSLTMSRTSSAVSIAFSDKEGHQKHEL